MKPVDGFFGWHRPSVGVALLRERVAISCRRRACSVGQAGKRLIGRARPVTAFRPVVMRLADPTRNSPRSVRSAHDWKVQALRKRSRRTPRSRTRRARARARREVVLNFASVSPESIFGVHSPNSRHDCFRNDARRQNTSSRKILNDRSEKREQARYRNALSRYADISPSRRRDSSVQCRDPA